MLTKYELQTRRRWRRSVLLLLLADDIIRNGPLGFNEAPPSPDGTIPAWPDYNYTRLAQALDIKYNDSSWDAGMEGQKCKGSALKRWYMKQIVKYGCVQGWFVVKESEFVPNYYTIHLSELMYQRISQKASAEMYSEQPWDENFASKYKGEKVLDF